ncbi:MAG: DNA polymerase/3'-5' exonuclease PolX [Parcubacteria group bacterium]|nr:DNA polymerase/3'-5' exonuclease PolX [Parcubacteria group bacterium]
MININEKLAKILYEMAELYEMDEVEFKPRVFERAAQSIKSYFDHSDDGLKDVYKKEGLKGLDKIPGVGKGIAERIEEYIKTGKIKDYEKMKKKIPVNIAELSAIEGVGPKLIRLFYKELKIKNIKDLERAVKEGKISKLPRAGEKLEQKILKSIEFHKRHSGRFRLGEVYNLAKKLEEKYKGTVAGSFRRWEETVGDLDILISKSNPKTGEKRKTIRFSNGLKSDLRYIDKKDWGSALQYFTGNKEHNIELRKIAKEKGFKLNEYGLFRITKHKRAQSPNKTQSTEHKTQTEEDVYEKLGLQYIPPEMRNNTGEIELAQRHPVSLPELVEEKDIKGDLHVHTHWRIKKGLTKERIKKAQELGYEYLGISDHTKFLAIEHGLNEKELLKQMKEIYALRITDYGLHILHGCEANILADGSIDIDDKALVQLDYVIAGVHSQFKMPKEKMTQRLITAMKNPHVDIISHPTGRVIHGREEYDFDLEKVLKVAKETGTVLEINSNPIRLDLRDVNIRRAKEAGVKMIINSDAHQNDQMDLMKFGVYTARRGWAEKKDIINTMSFVELSNFFKKPKNRRF